MEPRRPPRSPFRRPAVRFTLLVLALLALLFGGMQMRRFAWKVTKHLRFQRDIVNGFYWGSQTIKEGEKLSPDDPNSWRAFERGYFSLYERVRRDAYKGQYNLDYPPLRLLVMSIWAKEVRVKYPGAEDGTPEYVEPLLRVNMFCELLTAVGIFLLVRLAIRRAAGATDSRLLHRLPVGERATLCGLFAAAAAWLEPSMILDAHAWPQWDVWILPFYLFATLAGLTKRWFWCGCLLALGGMLKGQLLFVTPFFIFWPLWQKRWARAMRVLAGFAATAALIVSPWLLRDVWAWIAVAAIAGVAALILSRLQSRHTRAFTAGVAAIATFTVGALHGGSISWLKVGFLYGSEHYPYLFISSCYNLPSLMALLDWSLKTPFWTLHLGALHLAFTWQWTLRLLYLVALILCALGAARHTRNRDPRMLIAVATPWLLMFALLAQMHERYLLWGAVVSAVALGVSLRLSLLHFVFSLMSAAMIIHVLLIDKKLAPTLHTIDVLHRIQPIASWIFLAGAAIYFREVLSSRPPLFGRGREVRPVAEDEPLALAAAAEKA
ncbi:MAG: glycosyltransferase family 87 protein [Chthoniobacterales bacterium]